MDTIDEVFNQVDKLNSKKNELSENVRQRYETQQKAMAQHKADLIKRYEKLKSASYEEWDEVKRAYSESLERYKVGFDEFKKLFNQDQSKK
ncbi:MAG: hypothetical protein WC341_05805 [Bacteroidales bacterium]